MKNNPRRITGEDLELMALRWARSQSGRILNNINVDCFIAGFKEAHDMLHYHFAEFLIAEGKYYQKEYIAKREETLGYCGSPIRDTHIKEFKNAREFGEELEALGRKYLELKLL